MVPQGAASGKLATGGANAILSGSSIGGASGEMADTPDLGFSKPRFFALSFHCLNHVKTLDSKGENSLFTNRQRQFEKPMKVAQKVAQIQPGI